VGECALKEGLGRWEDVQVFTRARCAGENGSLEHVSGRVDTTQAVFLLLLPASDDAPLDAFRGVLARMLEHGDSAEGTAESLLRRVAPVFVPFVSTAAEAELSRSEGSAA